MLRVFGFQPRRGGPKLAQGKRPTGAPPWVETITEIGALKGRPYAVQRVVPPFQGFVFHTNRLPRALPWAGITSPLWG